MTDIVNGLAATPHRRAFCRAVAAHRSRIVYYRSTKEAWDQAENRKVTERLREAHAAGWVEPVPEEDLWPTAMAKEQGLTFYRLTEFGRVALRGDKSSTEKEERRG
jgi:hypothetical protein